jgi:hypothetical protein
MAAARRKMMPAAGAKQEETPCCQQQQRLPNYDNNYGYIEKCFNNHSGNLNINHNNSNNNNHHNNSRILNSSSVILSNSVNNQKNNSNNNENENRNSSECYLKCKTSKKHKKNMLFNSILLARKNTSVCSSNGGYNSLMRKSYLGSLFQLMFSVLIFNLMFSQISLISGEEITISPEKLVPESGGECRVLLVTIFKDCFFT